jgi:predicted nucleic acid-binding protein
MKIILDTNVIISAFVFKGNCGKVFDLSVNFFDSYICCVLRARFGRKPD